MGSIPTRSRHHALVLGLLVALAAPLVAQDTAGVDVDTAVTDTALGRVIETPDTLARSVLPDSLAVRRVAPFGAFFRSLLLPGWGQLRVGRKVTAGLFVVTEGITLGMSIKANKDVRDLRRQGADSAAIAAKVRTREDWYVLLAVNHLLAGLEAFIAAHLMDFPAELSVERSPVGVNARITVPLRLP